MAAIGIGLATHEVFSAVSMSLLNQRCTGCGDAGVARSQTATSYCRDLVSSIMLSCCICLEARGPTQY